jgi:hypothetical protein
VNCAAKSVAVMWPTNARKRWGDHLHRECGRTRKGQVKGIGGDDIVAQAAFVNSLFDVAA